MLIKMKIVTQQINQYVNVSDERRKGVNIRQKVTLLVLPRTSTVAGSSIPKQLAVSREVSGSRTRMVVMKKVMKKSGIDVKEDHNNNEEHFVYTAVTVKKEPPDHVSESAYTSQLLVREEVEADECSSIERHWVKCEPAWDSQEEDNDAEWERKNIVNFDAVMCSEETLHSSHLETADASLDWEQINWSGTELKPLEQQLVNLYDLETSEDSGALHQAQASRDPLTSDSAQMMEADVLYRRSAMTTGGDKKDVWADTEESHEDHSYTRAKELVPTEALAEDLQLYLKWHPDSQVLFQCPCSELFNSRRQLISHIGEHLRKPIFRCDKCPEMFFSKSLLQMHKHGVHSYKGLLFL